MDLETAESRALKWAKADLGDTPPLAMDGAWEDAQSFILLLDAEEYVRGRNDLAFLMDPPWVLVDKASTKTELLGWEVAHGRTAKMDRVA